MALKVPRRRMTVPALFGADQGRGEYFEAGVAETDCRSGGCAAMGCNDGDGWRRGFVATRAAVW